MDLHNDHRAFLRSLGSRLAEIRRERGLTQEQLAELAGVDPQTIQRAENGRTALSLVRLHGITKVLGVGLADLFGTETEQVPAAPWGEGDLQAIAAYRAIPADRKPWALRVLKALGGE